MKNKWSKLSKPILFAAVCVAGILFCLLVYDFVDYSLNGSFVDWFEKNFIITMERYSPDGTTHIISRELLWSQIKHFFLWIMIGVILFLIVVVFLTAHFHAKTKVKKSITDTSRMIHDFMDPNTTNTANIFPKEYAEISAQMLTIRSDIQKHEQILKEETERKNDLITYLAHDLKTSLTSVIGYLSLLDEIPAMPQDQKEKYIHISLDKAKRLEDLINEFFDITRYNLQQIQLEKETIDLSYMLLQLTDEFYPILQAHGNSVELNAGENITIYADALKLARVFNNILKNAVAYSYPNTLIQIWVEQTDMACKIYFRNKGKTIPPHKLDAIFEKFFRLDEARASNTGGAGLGPAIAKEIVTSHGGTILASSENEQTTFCVSLPLSD